MGLTSSLGRLYSKSCPSGLIHIQHFLTMKFLFLLWMQIFIQASVIDQTLDDSSCHSNKCLANYWKNLQCLFSVKIWIHQWLPSFFQVWDWRNVAQYVRLLWRRLLLWDSEPENKIWRRVGACAWGRPLWRLLPLKASLHVFFQSFLILIPQIPSPTIPS